MSPRKSVSVLFALCAAAFALPSVASADTFVQTSDHCSNACGITAGNFITVTQNAQAGTTTFSVTLAPGWAFVNTGASGSGGALNFGFGSALGPLTITNTSSNGWNTTTGGQFNVIGGTPNNGAVDTVSTALVQAPAANGNTFKFTNGIAISCNSSGGSTSCSTPLTFTINTLAALVPDSSGGSIFWADVINNNRTGGPTGLIDFTLQAVPLPPAALLFGSALVGLGILGRRRKNGLAQV